MSRSAPAVRILPLGEQGWTILLGETITRETHRRVTALRARIEAAAIPGVVEVVPAYTTLSVFFDGAADLVRGRLETICRVVERPGDTLSVTEPSTLHRIPVRYDGPDLEMVVDETGLPVEEVIRRHAEPEYLVYLLGFAPGFAYLGDLNPALVLPRRPAPRTRVPPGSVAIAGAQTAVYPLATPGGWHLIGSTDVRMFDPARRPPALLKAGDRVRFEPLT